MKPMALKKIVWAVDTMEPAEFHQNAEFVIGALARATSAQILPVHVLSYPFTHREGATDLEEAYAALAEKRLKELKGRSDLPNLGRGRVLINRDGSTRAAVDQLLDYADAEEADVIVASTHSRGAVAKFFMGSFAETLLLQSFLPVITVNPKSKVRERISRVLFPTPFDERSRPAFEQAVQLCKTLDASLTLLYKEPLIPMLDPSYELSQLLEQEAAERKAEANRWLEWARPYDVPLELRMDTTPGYVAEEIEFYAANNNFDLIVMVSETSEHDGPRVGSVCRRVVRAAQCPVWTLKAF